MNGLFLGLLALAGIAVYLPATLRARRTAPLTTAERFRRRMELIAPRPASGGPSSGRWIVVPESTDRLARVALNRSLRRRRRILIVLIVAAGISGAAAGVLGESGMLEAHLAIDAAFGGYVALLLETKRRRRERETKVRSLDARRRRRDAAFFEPVPLGRAKGQ